MVVRGYVQTKEIKTALSESTFLFFTCFILLGTSNPLHLKSFQNKFKNKQRKDGHEEERKKERKGRERERKGGRGRGREEGRKGNKEIRDEFAISQNR